MDEAFRWVPQATVAAIAGLSLVSLLGAFLVGHWLRLQSAGGERTTELEQSQEGMIVSGVLVVLGLLLGFTFSLALERFEQRRMLVVTEANSIGTSYLRSQLLDEPDRTRLSNLLLAYTDNRIELGSATSPSDQKGLIVRNDQLLTEIWAAVSAALDSAKGKTISTPLLQSFNDLVDHDSQRKMARFTGIPMMVMVLLYLFLVVTAGVVGFVLSGKRQRWLAVVMFVLLALAISIIADLNRPTGGTILESQQPMVLLRSMMAEPRSQFDAFRHAPPFKPGPAGKAAG